MSRRRGFTLIELMAVMVIMALILGMGYAAYFQITQASAIGSSIQMTREAVMSARSFSIAKSAIVTVSVSSSNIETFTYFRARTNANAPQLTAVFTTAVQHAKGHFLPRNVFFADASGAPLTTTTNFVFYPDGSAGYGTVIFQVREIGGRKGYEIKVNGLTGFTEVTDKST